MCHDVFPLEQIAPAEVEAVLLSHPAIKEACVVGRPHPRLVDVPTAFVVKQPAADDVTEAQLQDLIKSGGPCPDTTAHYYRPLPKGFTVLFVQVVFRTKSGSVEVCSFAKKSPRQPTGS